LGHKKVKPLFNKIDCVSLPVDNLDEALLFYHKKLGHEILWRHSTAVALKLPDSNSELVLHTENRGSEIDWKVDSVPEAIEQIIAAGGKLKAGPFDIKIGKCAVLCDPWNNQIVILDTSKGLLKVDENKTVIEDD
jgi:predicted enzyme related to lactoylglutathione lyase